MPPELILGMAIDKKVDLWSLGCTVYEMFSGKQMFSQYKNQPRNTQFSDLLWQMHSILRPIPFSYRQLGTKSKDYFDKEGKFKYNETTTSPKTNNPSILLCQNDSLTDFLSRLMRYNNFKREPVVKLISHEWLAKTLPKENSRIRFFAQHKNLQPVDKITRYALRDNEVDSDFEDSQQDQKDLLIPRISFNNSNHKSQKPSKGGQIETKNTKIDEDIFLREDDHTPLTRYSDIAIKDLKDNLLISYKDRLSFVKAGL